MHIKWNLFGHNKIENLENVRVNYDPKNKNEEVLAELGYPQRFGFPVFVILDANGNRIHTQNSVFFGKRQWI